MGGTLRPNGCVEGATCQRNPAPPLPQPVTNLGQALVSIGNYVYEFAVNSQNGHVLYTYWPRGGGSQGWYDLGPVPGNGTATTAPAAAAVGTYIYVTVTGSDHVIYLNQGFHPTWVGWK